MKLVVVVIDVHVHVVSITISNIVSPPGIKERGMLDTLFINMYGTSIK